MFLTTMVLAIPGLIPMLASFRVPHNSVPDVKDWNDRAELYDGPFTPLRENLVFAVTQSSMMDPNGFTLALFSSPTSTSSNPIPCIVSECTSLPARIAIDALGLIWRVPEYDFLALRSLAESTRPFANAWSLAVSVTCQPSDTIILPSANVVSDAFPYIRTYVAAFAPGRKRLEAAVKVNDGRVFTQLPEEIDAFLRLALQRSYSNTWGPRTTEEGENIIRCITALLRQY